MVPWILSLRQTNTSDIVSTNDMDAIPSHAEISLRFYISYSPGRQYSFLGQLLNHILMIQHHYREAWAHWSQSVAQVGLTPVSIFIIQNDNY